MKKRFLIPTCVVGGMLVVCLGLYGLMQYFGSPLIPSSLERRYTREVSAHEEELTAFAKTCLDTHQVPADLPLLGLVKGADLWGVPGEEFVEFSCDGWGLVPSSSYYGFYYSPQGPRAFQGVEVELTPQDGGYAWQAEGDNHGFTREIGNGFYYYEAHF
ncbi:MAG: hypothetical protein ACOYJZ_08595 [Acutalibacter sp.]|jgi:hypothetical protein